MIIRVVRMTFSEETLPRFLEHFGKYKKRIRATPGCRHLELWADLDNPTIIYTYSHWKSVEHLDDYRKSELFGEVWKQTKVWFSEPPHAWSADRLMTI